MFLQSILSESNGQFLDECAQLSIVYPWGFPYGAEAQANLFWGYMVVLVLASIWAVIYTPGPFALMFIDAWVTLVAAGILERFISAPGPTLIYMHSFFLLLLLLVLLNQFFPEPPTPPLLPLYGAILIGYLIAGGLYSGIIYNPAPFLFGLCRIFFFDLERVVRHFTLAQTAELRASIVMEENQRCLLYNQEPLFENLSQMATYCFFC